MDAPALELAHAPTALDTLIAILEKVEQFPTIRKYRQFKCSERMESEVLSKPGARDLLRALGYARDGECMALASPDAPVTLARVRTAIRALCVARASPAYAEAARVAALPAAARAEDEARAARRAEYRKRAPPEPAPGDGAIVTVRCVVVAADADSRAGSVAARASRRFRADDTFDGVVAWARGEEALRAWADAAPLAGDGPDGCDELIVRDVTTRREPPPTLSARVDGARTLQALGFWPSARLELPTARAGARADALSEAAAAEAGEERMLAAHDAPAMRPKPSELLLRGADRARFGAPAAGARAHHRVRGARAAALEAAEARRAQEERDLLLALRLQQDDEDALARRQREVDSRA